MLKKAKDLSKVVVKKAIPSGKDVFYSYIQNGDMGTEVTAKVNVVVNDDYSVSIIAEKDGVLTYNRIGENGVETTKTDVITITDDLKQKIDNRLYIVKALPIDNYICVDLDGVYWGMSLVSDYLNLSKLGKFDNLIDNLDSPNWSILNTIDDYFMYSNGYIGFIGNANGKSYKTDNLVCEFYYQDGGFSEAGVVYLDDKGVSVKLYVDDEFYDYVEDNDLNKDDFVLV